MAEHEQVRVHAPGRVNLMGDHVDYAGGLVLPMAIDLGTTLVARRGHARVVLASLDEPDPAEVALDVTDPAAVAPPWARYVAGVVAELAPATGFVGEVATTIPIGAGLSSSAALEVAVALALLGTVDAAGVDRVMLAETCRRAEQRASGVPCGVMDQLASLCGVEGHALLIDCASLALTPVPLPGDAEIVVIDSGERRALTASGYADRRAAVEAAAALVGPLPRASLDDVAGIDDGVIRRRARHVVSEIERVRAFAAALAAGDLVTAGDVMTESHRSLRDDHDVSTPRIDALVAHVLTVDGVHGARMTGGGWGGCVVALCDPGALDLGFVVRPAPGATIDAL